MHAIISFNNEGLKSLDVLKQVKKITNDIVLLNDGEIDEISKKLCSELSIQYIIFEKNGFKERHLVDYISTLNYSGYLLHLDSDEYISESLIKEIKETISVLDNFIYNVNFNHISNKHIIKFKNFSTRQSKPIMFKKEAINKIIGLPHKGIFLSGSEKFFENIIQHKADHIDYSYISYLKREYYFSTKDAKYRTLPIKTFINGEFRYLSPDSKLLDRIDSLRYRFPVILFLPCIFYRFLQSFYWLTLVRNLYTFNYELKIFIGRIFYQINLLIKIFIYKRNNI